MSDNIATLGAALIGAGIGVVTLVISKENKVSEFRQEWIDGLRADVSSLVAVTCAMQVQPMETAHYRELQLQLQECNCRITLRFKKDDKQGEPLLVAVQELVFSANAFEPPHLFRFRVDAVRETTQLVLKEEWERVKAGEEIYRRTLLYARILSTSLAIAIPIWLFIEYCIIPLITWLPELFKN